MAEEAPPDPVDLVVGERFDLCEVVRAHRTRGAGGASGASGEERESEREGGTVPARRGMHGGRIIGHRWGAAARTGQAVGARSTRACRHTGGLVESVLTTPPRARSEASTPWPSSHAPPARRAARLPWGVLTAALLVGAWWIIAPRTPDLAGQVYRTRLFEQAGFVLWNNGWYAGHQVPGYSLTWPWLASWLGVRASGVLAVLASAYLFERLARRLYGERTAAAAVWFAVAAAGDAWIGRLTFALGVTFALAAALCAARAVSSKGRSSLARDPLAGLLGGICAATSPVAGLLLVLAYVSWAIGAVVSERSSRAGRDRAWVRARVRGAAAAAARRGARAAGRRDRAPRALPGRRLRAVRGELDRGGARGHARVRSRASARGHACCGSPRRCTRS